MPKRESLGHQLFRILNGPDIFLNNEVSVIIIRISILKFVFFFLVGDDAFHWNIKYWLFQVEKGNIREKKKQLADYTFIILW